MDEPTTVRLTGSAQIIKQDLANIYGLKNILSAGLILFGKLSSKEREQAIKEANGNLKPDSDESLDEQIRQLARDVATLTLKLERRASASVKKRPRRKRDIP